MVGNCKRKSGKGFRYTCLVQEGVYVCLEDTVDEKNHPNLFREELKIRRFWDLGLIKNKCVSGNGSENFR